ncbi:MAG: hypothetical protein JHC39_11370, partial [Lentimicrobium sp.]|nr:hypothetical protein [Lentimicrobium sp.]
KSMSLPWRCITLFIDAYNLSILEGSVSISLDENDISAILHNFIYKNPERKKWQISSQVENHLFDEKMNFYTKGFAAKQSRIDFKFGVFWSGNEYDYFVEAKNLKSSDSHLKRRYIDTGMNNFLSGGKYQNCDGFLVGYVLEGNIKDCVDGINKLLEKDGRKTEILFSSKLFSFDLFCSNHIDRDLNHKFLLYSN